jgi:hypothetical protein
MASASSFATACAKSVSVFISRLYGHRPGSHTVKRVLAARPPPVSRSPATIAQSTARAAGDLAPRMTTTPSRSALWRHPGFVKLWAAQTVSAFGDQVTLLACRCWR